MASHTRPTRPQLQNSSRSSTNRYSIYPAESHNPRITHPHLVKRTDIQPHSALTDNQRISTAPDQLPGAPVLGLNIGLSGGSQRLQGKAGDIQASSQRKPQSMVPTYKTPKEYPWTLFKICIRSLTTTLSIALLVLNTLAGVFLPRGSEFDLLWDILFSIVLVLNAMALISALLRRRNPLLPPTRPATHYLVITLDFLIFAALATFSLFDGFYILRTNWHFLLLSDSTGTAILKREDLLLPKDTSDTIPPQVFANEYEKWILVAVAACIVAGALAIDHLFLAILEFMEYRVYRRSEKAVGARYFGRRKREPAHERLRMEMLRDVKDKVGMFPIDEVIPEGYDDFDNVKLDAGQGQLRENEPQDV
jgi:hypothetical protein